MKADTKKIGVSYLRLSDEDLLSGESASITNQRRIIEDYCKNNGIFLVGEFIDDGWSGGNFERPGFQQLMRELQKGVANIVITKDLSRLGRDMRESSYYAEQFFPEHNIRYIAIGDNFDTEHDNIMAPFHFAMNEVYLRQGSQKIKEGFKNKRLNGLYYACPPYGYIKDEKDKNHLIPDPNTAHIVQRIFKQASMGDSSRKISIDLNTDDIIPPLKYRALYRDSFTEKGMERISDYWNHTTVKRILKNEVYLGKTVLGKTKNASFKSKKKIPIDKKNWAITENTHEALVTQEMFEDAQRFMAKNTKKWHDFDNVRKSIFSGVVYCSKCGHSLCSCGSVYKGEREKYWYLSCIRRQKGIVDPCEGVRIRYKDMVELVKNDINSFISLDDSEIKKMAEEIMLEVSGTDAIEDKKNKLIKAKSRLQSLDRAVQKIYMDNADGKLSDDRFYTMLSNFEKESAEVKETIKKLEEENVAEKKEQELKKFFDLIKQSTHIDTLDRETLLTFIDRIEVGEKKLPDGVIRNTHNNQPFTQEIRIFYKFAGNLSNNSVIQFPQN